MCGNSLRRRFTLCVAALLTVLVVAAMLPVRALAVDSEVNANGDEAVVAVQKEDHFGVLMKMAGTAGDWTGVKISQELKNYNASLGPFTSVYRVDAYRDGEVAFSNVYGLDSSDAGSLSLVVSDVLLEDLDGDEPVYVEPDVEVTLLYAGPSYSGDESIIRLGSSDWDMQAEAPFNLNYNGGNRGGYGLVNGFHLDPVEDPGVTDGFELPSTGAAGPRSIVLAGLALGCVGLAGLVFTRRRRAALALLLAVSIMGLAATPASAAKRRVGSGGGTVVNLGVQCELHEDVDYDAPAKALAVKNASEANDCFVRVRAFQPLGYGLEWTCPGGWRDGNDGWYYYDLILPAGGTTSDVTDDIDDDLCVRVTDGDGGPVVPGSYGADFNVVVVFECTPVIYGDDGAPYADWGTVYPD